MISRHFNICNTKSNISLKKICSVISLVSCLFLSSLTLLSQENEKINKEVKVHSAKKATILSAVLPGAGQIYNKKYWKLPLVIGGLGTSIYFISSNSSSFKQFRAERAYRFQNPGLTRDPELVNASDALLLSQEDQFRQWRDLSYVITGLVYVLNIIDANVDAHLFNFDVDEDLTINWQPSLRIIENNTPAPTLSIYLTFK